MKIIRLKTTLPVSAEIAFKHLASVKLRELWGAPEGDVIKYKNENFKTGRSELFKCGPKGNLEFGGIMTYVDIVRNEKIIFTESVHHKKNVFAHALIKIVFENYGSSKNHRTLRKKSQTASQLHPLSKCRIHIEMAIDSLGGEGVYNGYRMGWTESLKRLKLLLQS